MTAEWAHPLDLVPMVAEQSGPERTAFTVSVDYRIGMTTGISAEERAGTARALANDNCGASDFLRPGHVFPLIARARRRADAVRPYRGRAPTWRAWPAMNWLGVLAEVVNDDGRSRGCRSC